MTIKSQQKLITMLFESGDSPVMATGGDRFHLEDCIQYVTKPGIIVATIKGRSKYGIQHLPIGAVDSFRFMKITNERAIVEQEKNNGRSYDTIMGEYSQEKEKILEQWVKNNERKIGILESKYGKTLIGLDIVQNEKKFNPNNEGSEDANGEEIVGEDGKNNGDAKNDTDDRKGQNSDIKDALKDIAEFLKDNKDKLYEISDEKIEDMRGYSKNKKFFSKVDEIQRKYVGDKTPDQINKATQSKIKEELDSIKKFEPEELKNYKPQDFRKDGLKGVDKYVNAINVMQRKKQEYKQKKQENGGKEQLNEASIIGLILTCLQSIFNLAWSAISLIFAHPMAAGSLCLLFYIIGKNRKK